MVNVTQSQNARPGVSDAQLALLASIVASSEDAISGETLDGIVTSWNKAAEAIYGYTAEEMIGKPFSVLLAKDRPDEMVAVLDEVRDGRRVEHYETVRVRKDGSTIAISVTVSPIRDTNGSVVGASSIARDVTDRLREEERTLTTSQYARSLIEVSLDPLVTISAEGKITDVNEGSIKVTGVPREKLIGTDFCDYFTEPDQARTIYQQVFAKGSVRDYPLTIRHRDGHLTEVLYNASVYKDASGKVLGVFAAARDVTAQKHAEVEVADRRTREMDRLGELERFQKLIVGRELKMIELKKEIAALKRAADPELPSR